MKKVVIDDLKEFHFLSRPTFNPAGSKIAFVKSKSKEDYSGYEQDLWLANADGSDLIRLTSASNVSNFIWKDDETILFSAARQEEEKEAAKKETTFIYAISTKGGEATLAYKLPFSSGIFQHIGDDVIIASFTANDKNTPYRDLKDDADKDKEALRRKEEEDYEVLEEAPFWHNGGTFSSGNRGRIALYDTKADKLTIFGEGTEDLFSFELNKNKDKAVIIGQTFDGLMPMESMVYLLDVKKKKLTKSKLNPARYYDAFFLDNDNLLLRINEAKQHGLNENPKFFLNKLSTKTVKAIISDQDISIGNSVGTDMRYGDGADLIVKNEEIYYIETNDTDAFLKSMDREGKLTIHYHESGSVDSFDVSDEGKICAVMMEPNGLEELYLLSEGKAEKITSFNDAYLADHSISKAEPLRITSSDDTVVAGFVLKPRGYKEGRKYPGVLVIHGGPKTVYGNVFVHEMQVWANEGYFVFFCNPRGSDGKGNDFMNIFGKYGTIDYEDLMNFTDEVLKAYPDIDEKKLGVTGGSYGGFMTNWIIGHTDRFKCAASQRSISNWLSFFGTSDIGYYFAPDQNMAWPWENAAKLWEHSPMKYADQVKTPTLFIHSDEDYRCWIPEGYQMFTSLKVHGVEARMVVFHGENHELSRSGKPKHRLRRLNEITNWFEKYLSK